MKEYRVIRDTSARAQNNPQAIEDSLNKLANEGFRVVSSCSYVNRDIAHIYIVLEREVEA